MKEFFASRKESISRYLEDFLTSRGAELESINAQGPVAAKRLLDYSREGKMIRGCLAGLAQGLFSSKVDTDADRLGSVMELFQSALLVHDDIMDRDPLRRGKPAMHIQYARSLKEDKAADPDRTGESLGICVGDIAFFLAYEILSSLDVSAPTSLALLKLCSREMTGVGLGQMQDIRAGVMPEPPAVEDVLSLYVNKTGRYTFSLPLMSGAVLGGADEEMIDALSELGEVLGIIFQIKDDELGLFGTPEKIGKPVGTDLSEGKQTIFYNLLMQKLSTEDAVRVKSLVGRESVPEQEVLFVRQMLVETGVMEKVREILKSHQEKAHRIMKLLPLSSEYGRIFTDFVEYNLSRTV